MQYEWLIFDADGTLFDYDRAEETALRQTFESLAIPFNSQCHDVYRRINKQLWLDFELGHITSAVLRVTRFERLFAEMSIDRNAAEFNERYLLHLADAAELMDGALDVVRQLHRRFKLSIMTNGLKEVQERRFARSPIKEFFPILIISEVVGAAKPHPAIFDAAFLAMGQPPKEHVLFIGDSLTSDIQGGFNYGIDTCWFNPSGAPRTLDLPIKYEIRRLEELLSILAPL